LNKIINYELLLRCRVKNKDKRIKSTVTPKELNLHNPR